MGEARARITWAKTGCLRLVLKKNNFANKRGYQPNKWSMYLAKILPGITWNNRITSVPYQPAKKRFANPEILVKLSKSWNLGRRVGLGLCPRGKPKQTKTTTFGWVPSPKLTAKAPENGWLEYDPFLLGNPIFRWRLLLVSGSVLSHWFAPGRHWTNLQKLFNSPGLFGANGWDLKKTR